jgi:TnpA family transposase
MQVDQCFRDELLFSHVHSVKFQQEYQMRHGSLASLVSRADQTIDTEQIAKQWDRMGQLCASLKTGHVTASVAHLQNRVHPPVPLRAGIAQPNPARLAQSRATPRLARDVFYGLRGRIKARELWEQMNTCSCLNLILACMGSHYHWNKMPSSAFCS